MTIKMAVLAAGLATGAVLSGGAQAQHLQPGMRTMIQQGGVEGTVLGGYAPFAYAVDPYHGYVYDDPRYGRVVFHDPYAGRYDDGGRHADPYAYRRGRVRVSVPHRRAY